MNRAGNGAAWERWVRWWKFNLVGAAGMVVQFSVLGALIRFLPGHYLAASAIAVEVTLLHNFAWHVHYTWRDRGEGDGRTWQLLRFHLSNGLVSLVGNLAMMRLLVQEAHCPVLVANGAAVLVCSIANFYLGDSWAFETAGE